MNKLRIIYRWILSGPFDRGVAVMMALTGAVLIATPDRGIAGYVQQTYGFPMTIFGAATIFAGGVIWMGRGPRVFLLAFTPTIGTYALMGVAFAADGLLTNNVMIGTTAWIAWPFILWVCLWVNDRRAKLIISEVLHGAQHTG